jgi:hypothetical protein
MPLLSNTFAGSSPHPKTRCPSIRRRKETGIHDSFALRLAGATTRFWPCEKQNRKSLARSKPLPTIRDAQKAAGVRLPPLLTRAKGLSSALLTAALLAAATLLLALALLAFTFLVFPIVLLAAALLSLTGPPAWFVWIALCFHIAFH